MDNESYVHDTELKPDVKMKKKSSTKGNGFDDINTFTTTECTFASTKCKCSSTKQKRKSVPYRNLFRYADKWDIACILIGTIAAVIHGAGLPVMFIFFGDLTTLFARFGRYQQCLFNYTLCFAMNFTNLNQSKWDSDIQPVLDSFKNTSIERVYYFLYVACGVFILGTIQVFTYSLQSVRQAKRLRIEYFRSILRQDIAFHDMTTSGELNARLSSDIKKAKDGLGEKVSFIIQYVSMTVTGVTIGIVYTWKLGLVTLSVAPLLVFSGALLFIFSDLYSKKEQAAYSKAGSTAEEAISAIRTVTAFGCQDKEVERYSKSMKGARKAAILRGFMSGLGIGLLYITMFGMYGLSFWYGSTLVINKEIELGDLTTSFFGILIASFALGTACSYLGTFAEAQAAVTNIFQIIDRKPDIDVFSKAGKEPNFERGDVVFNEVNFSFPSRADTEVLSNVSFRVEQGQTVALVGRSGCGKSTIFQLIQRFYDPNSGKITVGGKNIQTMNVRSLRNSIGVVSQEPVLFATTIAENIRWGRRGITMEQIKEAAKRANAYGFISKLPNQFHTIVGEGGSQLSGGQKQRISIARAIVRDPKILLLDEATSALDSTNERAVQKALQEAVKNRTTIIIAHRLSTIRYAKKIFVLHDGKVVEEGSHNELMLKNKYYANLTRIQLGVHGSDETIHIDTPENNRFNGRKIFRDNSTNLNSKRWKRTWSTRILRRQASLSLIPSNYVKEYSASNHSSRSSLRQIESNNNEVATTPSNEEPQLNKALFRKVMKLNVTEWPYIAAGCIFAAIAGATDPVNAIVFAKVLAIFTLNDPEEQSDLAILYGLVYLALGAISLLAFTVESTLFAKSGIELTLRLRKRALASILRQDMSFFDDLNNSTAALSSRLGVDAARVQGCTGARLGIIIKNFSSLGVALGIGFGFSWKLTLVTLGFIPFLIIGGLIEMHLIVGDETEENNTYDEAGQLAGETIRNIRTVASLSSEQQIHQLYALKLTTPARKLRKKAILIGAGYGYSQCVIFFISAATFRLGIDLLVMNDVTFENVFKVLTAVFFGAMAVSQNSSFAPDYAEAKVAAARLFDLFDRKPSIDPSSEEGHSPVGCKGGITLRSVSFHYPSRPDIKVLNGCDFSIEAGKTLALVGQSGCGKSTIVQLLERFYDPQGGHVMLDGVDIREFNVSWLRQQIAVVSQEPVLFNETIKENILYGDQTREVPFKEIESSSKNAHAHLFVSAFNNGYHTLAGEKGGKLSGGQKQRIAIARALLRDPKILILDEATSALDAESEKAVQEALKKASKGRTTIIIAHRLSSIKEADKIAVIDRGKIIEHGTHQTLMEKGGVYHSLVNSQWPSKNRTLSTTSLF